MLKIGPMGKHKNKTPKLQENGLSWLFAKNRNRKTKPPPPPKEQKREGLKTPSCTLNNNPLFLVNVLFLCKLHFMQLLCLAENNIKIVFSAEHGFLCITDSDTLLIHIPTTPFLGRRGCIFWKLPQFTVVPMSVVFSRFLKTPKIQKIFKTVMPLYF